LTSRGDQAEFGRQTRSSKKTCETDEREGPRVEVSPHSDSFLYLEVSPHSDSFPYLDE
jgi:hypothetical protein